AGLYGTIYRVPAMHARVRGVFTNTTPTDAYRGAGRPEANYVTERLIDRAAVEIGMDAAEIRRRNLLTPEDIPFVSPGGLNFDSADCVTHLEIALDHIGYGERESRRAEAKARGKAYGIGVAYYMERTGGGPIENATLKILPTGKAQAAIGTQSNGQGHETAWAQLIHQKLGIDPSCIELIQGDTAVAPPGGGTGGSRSLIMAHRVFFEAADDLIEKGREAAAQKLEAAVADIEFSAAEGGVFRVAGTDKMLDLFQAAEAAEATTGTAELLGIGGVTESTATFPNGAHVVEMEIDLATGEPTVTRYVIVDDFGRVVNPLLVEGQVHGGIAQGLGQALMENGVYDPESGQPLAGSYMDYAMPRAADLPMFETTISEQAPATTNPLGVKGCGEAGSVGAIGAVTLAALDALRPYGVQDLETPLTPSVLWQAIQDSKV
ncbi:MAG: molybdopterin cofactor-binding domain-containing protein, partial [Pseudomonadota bacterium]